MNDKNKTKKELIAELAEARERIDALENRFSKLSAAANDGFWEWDLLTDDVFLDQRCCEMAGYDVDEFPHRLEEFKKRVHPDDLEMVMDKAQAHIVGSSERFVVEFRFLTKDGSWMWILGSGVISKRDESGTPLQLLGTHADITRQMLAMLHLRESEERFRILYNNLPDMYVSVSAEDASILMCNDTFLNKTGYERSEVIGAPISTLYHEDCLPVSGNVMGQFLKTGKIRNEEQVLKRKDGGRIDVSLNVDAVRDENGNIMFSMSSWRDISEQKKLGEALLESEEKFSRSFYAHPTPMQIIDLASRIRVGANDSFCKLFGYSSAELAEKTIDAIQFVKNPEEEKRSWQILEEQGEVHDFPVVMLTKAGEERHILLNAAKIPLSDQELVVGSFVDITKRVQTEEALRKSEEKFKTLFDKSPDVLAILNFDYQIVDVNERALEVLGYNYDELKDLRISRVLVRNTDEESDSLNAQLEKNGRALVENILRTKDRREIPVEISATVIDYEGEKAILTMSRDISERIRVAQQLKLQSHALNAAASAIVITDIRGNIVWTNPAFSKATGYSISEAIGKNPRILNSGQHDASFYKNMWETISRGKIWRNEIINKRKDGSLYPEEMTIAPLLTEDNRITNFVAIKQDISERKQAEKSASEHLAHLSALRKIDQAVANTLDIRVTINIFLQNLREQLNVDAANVLSYDKVLRKLSLIDAQGISQTRGHQTQNLRLGQSLADQIAHTRQDKFILDLSAENNPSAKRYTEKGFKSYFGVPLIAKGSMIGVLEVIHKTPLEPNNEWIDFLHTLAGQAALALDNYNLFNNLQRSNVNLIRAYDETIRGWAQALELRDMETVGHSQRVVKLTMELAKAWGFKGETLRHIQRGALLHDIGKMGIPDSILLKPGKLTEEEWEIMKMHPVYAFEWLSPIDYLRPALDIPHFHHEKWDGTGYPTGLKGDQIPTSARIFTIVDVWDALRSDRPYRKAWSEEKTLDYIQELSGTQFDPDMVELFMSYLQSPAYARIRSMP